MKNTMRCLGIIALVAVIGFSFALTFTSCENGTTNRGSSLNGVWVAGGGAMVININGSTGVISQINGGSGTRLQSAVDKGLISVGNQYFRNLNSTGNLTWSGQELGIGYNTSAPNVALTVDYRNTTITLSADGRSLYSSVFDNTLTRR